MADTMPRPAGQTPSGLRCGGTHASLPPEETPAENRRGPGAEDALAQAQALATEFACAVRDAAVALLDEQRTHAANEIAALGEVLHISAQSLDRTGDALDPRGGGNVSRYTEGAAQQIGRLANRLRRYSVGELNGDIVAFARGRPIGFIVSAIAVGLIAGRLLASSAARQAGQDPAGQQPDGQRETLDALERKLDGAPSRGEGTQHVEEYLGRP